MSLSSDEAWIALQALIPRKKALEELLENPMLQLPEGIVDLKKAKQQLLLHHEAMVELSIIAELGVD